MYNEGGPAFQMIARMVYCCRCNGMGGWACCAGCPRALSEPWTRRHATGEDASRYNASGIIRFHQAFPVVLYGAVDTAHFKAPAEGGEGVEGTERRGSGAGAAGRGLGPEGRAGCRGSQGERADKPWGGFYYFLIVFFCFCFYIFPTFKLFSFFQSFHFGKQIGSHFSLMAGGEAGGGGWGGGGAKRRGSAINYYFLSSATQGVINVECFLRASRG